MVSCGSSKPGPRARKRGSSPGGSLGDGLYLISAEFSGCRPAGETSRVTGWLFTETIVAPSVRFARAASATAHCASPRDRHARYARSELRHSRPTRGRLPESLPDTLAFSGSLRRMRRRGSRRARLASPTASPRTRSGCQPDRLKVGTDPGPPTSPRQPCHRPGIVRAGTATPRDTSVVPPTPVRSRS